ncbi:hypothetical protein JCM21714_3906 [Gracilibacillus boraciitolerans JCM 21714]|uniref:Uncharacterized protein n=1 Tax=Gracilibacillus boraciitolerans JCM 21714 TaxID=1298598 RepID=W4VNE4_9BACI|nr:hypothetical protein [Gracilibacillus boraciitolerans]GAE94722.1 hypothetical protein JCM21714_3906 [Gracilibacillus boraciitolerans JCM 21714]
MTDKKGNVLFPFFVETIGKAYEVTILLLIVLVQLFDFNDSEPKIITVVDIF